MSFILLFSYSLHTLQHEFAFGIGGVSEMYGSDDFNNLESIRARCSFLATTCMLFNIALHLN